MIKLYAKELSDYKKYICDTSSIYFSSILQGTVEGVIWAEQTNSPEFLLVWSPYQEGFQLMGRPLKGEMNEEVRTWFYQEIIPFMEKQGVDTFEYGADTEELAQWFNGMFPEKNICSEKQKIFVFKKMEKELPKPEGYQIEKVDCKTMYSQEGIGYVAIQDNTVVARASMLFQVDGYGNISVDTKEGHRRKGLAAYLAQKTIEDTLKRGLTPIWDCAEDNLASERTAEKLGFLKVREEDVYWF